MFWKVGFVFYVEIKLSNFSHVTNISNNPGKISLVSLGLWCMCHCSMSCRTPGNKSFCGVFSNGNKDYVERQRSSGSGGNRILKGALVHVPLQYKLQNTRKQSFCGVFSNGSKDYRYVERQRSSGSGGNRILKVALEHVLLRYELQNSLFCVQVQNLTCRVSCNSGIGMKSPLVGCVFFHVFYARFTTTGFVDSSSPFGSNLCLFIPRVGVNIAFFSGFV